MYCCAYFVPIWCRMRIDTMFFDFGSAVRIVIGPSKPPS